MVKQIISWLTALLVGTAQVTAQGQDPSTNANLPAAQIVAAFAKQYLSEAAQQRLNAPNDDVYETLMDAEGPDLSDTMWGQILIEELLHYSQTGVWLDWKYNVLTLMLNEDPEPGWDNLLGQVFDANGLPAITDDERQTVLNEAQDLHGDRPEVLMIPRLQQLADARGARILIIENQSDGLLLTVLPNTTTLDWHLIQLGDVLLLDGSRGVVNDPRNGGRQVVLFN